MNPAWLLLPLLAIGAAADGDGEAVADEEGAVLLLQTAAGVQRSRAVQPAELLDAVHSPSERLEVALPLVWMHVPKTGSSVANTLIRLPGVCPEIAEELDNESYSTASLDTTRYPRLDTRSYAQDSVLQFEIFRDESRCPGLRAPPNPDPAPETPPIAGEILPMQLEPEIPLIGQHKPVGPLFETHYDGHGVTMLRQPEQRVISAQRMVANQMGIETEDLAGVEPEDLTGRMADGLGFHPSHLVMGPIEPSFLPSRSGGGCAVRMLAGEEDLMMGPGTQTWEACWILSLGATPRPEVPAEVIAEAQARLRRFAFVGIQEEWHLSVCLLHAMFGGECSLVEFENTRPRDADDVRQGQAEAVFAAPELYDTSVLGGWVDTADRALYDTGLEMFHGLCAAHGVTLESCEPCFRSAGLF